MICPNCKTDALYEKNDMVVCSNCGFKASRLEYNIWKKIYAAKPHKQERVRFHDNEEMYTGSYTNTVDRYMPLILVGFVLMIVLIILLS